MKIGYLFKSEFFKFNQGMLKKGKSLFFEGELKRFEKILLDYFVEVGNEKGRNEIDSHILGYLMLHQNLTQKQIRELSREYFIKNTKRGISNGSISNILNGIYFKIGIINKNKVDGSNYLFEYSTSRHISRSTLESTMIGLRFINDLISSSLQISNSLQEISVKDVSDVEFYNKFIKRMNEFMEFIFSYKNIIEKSISFHRKNSNDKNNQKNPSIDKNREDHEEISNENIFSLEKKLISLIIKSPIFQFLKSDYIRISGYFITREKCTQKKLKSLTGYSIGHISQGLNKLLELEIIQSYKEKGVRKSTYIMNSIGYSLIKRYLVTIQKTNEFKPMLIGINEQLENRKEEWQKLNGYGQIKKFVEERIEMMEYFDFLEEIMENELKKFSLD
jgi:DNA-binding transcriptional regulator GbsR (MarR family)